jgi:hypothetical protein
VLERTVKGVTHDKAAISVAPPKQYARRFLDFATRQVFMSEYEYHSSLQQYGCSVDQAGSLAGVLQQQQLQQQQLQQQQLQQQFAPAAQQFAPAAMQSPWAMQLVDPQSAVNAAAADQQQPMQQQQQQLDQASQQQQQEQLPRLAQNGSFGPQMPLVTEDSFPLPPGQLGSESSGSTLAAPGPAAAAAAAGATAAEMRQAAASGFGVVLQQGAAAASPVLPDEQSMLLELLAAPTGMIQLTSGGANNASAADAAAAAAAVAEVDAAGGGDGKHAYRAAAALGQQLSEEQVQVRLESLGSYDCPAAAAVSNGGQQQQQQQVAGRMPAAVAAGEHGDGVLVPAVVVELQGVADRAPASKQGSLERQADVPAGLAGVNGVKGVNGHVAVVNGVGHSS